MHNYHMKKGSKNGKVGPIVVSTTSRSSCPDSCPLKNEACYAAAGPLSWHWNKVDSGERGTDFEGFIADLMALEPGTKFRHNQAGDLPGYNGNLQAEFIGRLAEATAHLDRPWTYTHYEPNAHNLPLLRQLNASMVVNLSADTMEQADTLAATGLPVCVTVPEDHPEQSTTPGGNNVVVCPFQTGKVKNCDECMLCAYDTPNRCIVGFRAHGTRKRILDKRLEA